MVRVFLNVRVSWYVINIVQQDRASDLVAGGCSHPLVTDGFQGVFGEWLRRLSCHVCGCSWWDSNGSVICSTAALRIVAMLEPAVRPRGCATRDAEWAKLQEDGLAPLERGPANTAGSATLVHAAAALPAA